MQNKYILKNKRSGNFLLAIHSLKKERQKQRKEMPFNIRSCSNLKQKAHNNIILSYPNYMFSGSNDPNITEYTRIMNYDYIFKWIEDDLMDEDMIKMEDLSKDDWREYRMKRSLNHLRSLEYNIQELKRNILEME